MWDHIIALIDMKRESTHLQLHWCFTVTSGWICRRLAVGRNADLKHYIDRVWWVWVLLCRSVQTGEDMLSYSEISYEFSKYLLIQTSVLHKENIISVNARRKGKELLWSAFLKTSKSSPIVFKIPLKKVTAWIQTEASTGLPRGTKEPTCYH